MNNDATAQMQETYHVEARDLRQKRTIYVWFLSYLKGLINSITSIVDIVMYQIQQYFCCYKPLTAVDTQYLYQQMQWLSLTLISVLVLAPFTWMVLTVLGVRITSLTAQVVPFSAVQVGTVRMLE